MILPISLVLISGGIFVTWIDPTYQEVKDKQVEKARYEIVRAHV